MNTWEKLHQEGLQLSTISRQGSIKALILWGSNYTFQYQKERELSLDWKVGIYLAGEHTSVSIFFFLSLKNICKRRHFQKNSGS